MTLKGIYRLLLVMAGFLILVPILTKIFSIGIMNTNENSLLIIIGLIILTISEALKRIDTRLDKMEKELKIINYF